MDVSRLSRLFLVLSPFFVASCGGGGSEGKPPVATPPVTLYQVEALAAQETCVDWFQLRSGPDDNADGVLNDAEVAHTEVICHGEPVAGRKAQLAVVEEPAGENCALTGRKVNVGADDNKNETLDDSEVAGTHYFCRSLEELYSFSSSIQIQEDQPLDSTLVLRDVEGLVFEAISEPTSGTLVVDPSGAFNYAPNADFYGTDSFIYTVSDGEVSIEQEVSIEIAPVNDEPTVEERDFSVYAGSYIVRQLVASDLEDEDVSFEPTTQPAFGEATLSESGLFGYRASASYVGSDSFTFQMNDGHGNTEPVEIVVAVSAAPEHAVLDLEAALHSYNGIGLTWTAVYCPDTVGYEIRYSTELITEDNWFQATRVSQGLVPAEPGAIETASVANLEQSQGYYLAVRLSHESQELDPLSNVVYIATVTPPVISIAPETIPDMVAEHNQEASQSLVITNTGGFDLQYYLEVGPSTGSQTGSQLAKTTRIHPAIHSPKGSEDSRKACLQPSVQVAPTRLATSG
jgi:hypothetical protein